MREYDFRCVRTGVLLPLIENDFLFAVAGASVAVVTKDGISCSLMALLQLTHAVDMLEMDIVFNLIDLSQKAMITALFFREAALQVGAARSRPASIRNPACRQWEGARPSRRNSCTGSRAAHSRRRYVRPIIGSRCGHR